MSECTHQKSRYWGADLGRICATCGESLPMTGRDEVQAKMQRREEFNKKLRGKAAARARGAE